MAVAQHALTLKSKGQRSRSSPTWVCMSIRLLGFSGLFQFGKVFDSDTLFHDSISVGNKY